MEEILVGLVMILMVALAIRMFIVMFDGAKETLEVKPMDYRYEEFLVARNQVVEAAQGNQEPLSIDETASGFHTAEAAEPTMAIHAASEEDVREYPKYELKAELLPVRKTKKKFSKKKKSTKKKTKTRGKK